MYRRNSKNSFPKKKEEVINEIVNTAYNYLLEEMENDPEFVLTELNIRKAIKNAILAGGIAVSALTGLKGQAAVDTLGPKVELAYQMSQKVNPGAVLATVKGPTGTQSISNLDLDAVHGILSSKKLSDDLEDRVSVKLKELRSQGYMPEVANLKVETKVVGDKVITNSSCDIVQSTDGNAYTVFTTRGSIGIVGSDYVQRHDKQIDGLQGRLEAYFGGPSKLLKTIHIKFKIGTKEYGYKQSFFTVSTAEDEAISNILVQNFKNSASVDSSKAELPGGKDTLQVKPTSIKKDNLTTTTQTAIDTTSASDYKVQPPHAERTVGKSFSTLLNQLDQEIGDELKSRGGGYLSKYKISTQTQADGSVQYMVDWEVRNDDPSHRYTAMTRRGNINISPAAAKADVQGQVRNAVSRLQAAGYTDIYFPFKDGISTQINEDSYWYEMPILMNTQVSSSNQVKEGRLSEQKINRLKLLAGII